ncbi:MAG TPA: PKD domain-containing protein [Bacteroidales bacterium]|nr:PKD domain-containing protein [Bacteroidales bacterium]
MRELSQNISIDKVQGKTVFAYANPEEWEYFKTKNIKFEPVWDYYFAPKSIVMATTVAQMANWDRYPTHAVYLEMLDNFAANYPSLCKVEVIGNSVNGKPIKCLVISDNVNSDEDEPSFWWSGTMHGDETTGWILLLRLADYLLSNYGTDPQVTNLVNNVKIYINPLANPDGTFYGSSTYTSIANARRNNQNNVDLNRNFPKVLGGTVDNQPEIQIMMDYVAGKQFVMSANTHGGTELINYPWDCWRTVENAHPDDNWWYYVSTVYVNNVRANSPASYFDGPGQMYDGSYNYTGITQGADWYYAYGSRQDWMNYFAYIKEVTLELSDTKKLDVEYLNAHWTYNKQAMLDYMEQVLYGFRGIVTDACTGQPLSGVKVEIVGHDKDNSHVFSFAPVGNYHRPIYAGTYDVTFSKSGYQSVTYTVTVQNNQSTRLDVQLYPTGVATPNFTASQVNVPIGTNVTFTDQSSGGTVSSRLWTFNGGNPSTSTNQNPVVNYANPGNYNVNLQIVSNGCTRDELKENYIHVYIPGAPVANFQANKTFTCDGIIQFTDLSQDAISYLWNFGDGNTSTEENPQHTYYSDGVYTVSLTVTNANGSDTKTITDYIIVDLVESPVTQGAESCGAATLTLTASGGDILQWYDAPTGGNLLYTGTTLTQNFTQPTTYYVQSGYSEAIYDAGNTQINTNGSNHTASNAYYLLFDAYKPFKLVSVQVNSGTAGSRIIELRNSSDQVLQTITVNLTTGINTVNLNWDIPQGSNYRLKCGTSTPNLWRNNTGTNFPYTLPGVLSITGTNAGDPNYYYYFYNWKVLYGDECVSVRTPVIATIHEVPGAVTVSGGGSQCGGSMTLTATGGTGGTIYWQGTTSNGTSTTTPSTSQTVSASGTYYFRALAGSSCWGPQGSATVTINPVPGDVTVSGGGTQCGGSMTLTATGGTGGTIYWQGTTSNGTSTTTPSTSQTVSASGTYYFRARSNEGCWGNQGSATVTINPVPGDVTVSGGGTQCGGSMTLTATGGTGGTIYWQGTTSNGTSTTTPSTSQTVSASGTYYFRARSNEGCWGNQGSAMITINPVPGDVTVSGGGTQCGGSITLTATGGTGGTIYWQGTTSNGTSTTTPSTSQTVSASGTYYFRARSNEGCWGNQGSAIVTIHPAFTLSTSVQNESNAGANDGSITVTITGGTQPFVGEWNTNVITNATENIIIYSGLTGGAYSVTVTDFNGCTASTSAIVNTSGAGPVADFAASLTSGCDYLTIQFEDLSNNNPNSWYWEFGDGQTSTEQNPVHTYYEPGTYTVSLTVSNIFGSNTHIENNFITIGITPQIVLTMTEESVAGNDGTASVIVTGGVVPISILWNNGMQTNTITGLTAGNYCVTVSDNFGCYASDCIEVTQESVFGQPIANFIANQTQACGSLTVQFTDLSQNNPTSWLWNFGDGETSTEQNPIHIYSTPGSYTVSLTVSNDNGNDIKVVENYITVWSFPQLEFIITPESYSGASDGAIELIINGGTPPYIVTWSNGMSGEYISGLTGGLYSVAVIDYHGCYATSSVLVETSTFVNVSNDILKVYPNPANNHITIEISGTVEKGSIVNTLGQKVLEIVPQSERFDVNISGISEGIYFLKLSINGNEYVYKLIKK